MALAHRATGTVAGADSGNLTVTLPANQANDIITIEAVQHDNVLSTIAGYTLIGSQTNGASMITRVFQKRSKGAETNPVITHAAGGQIIACATVHSGADSGLTVGVGAGSTVRDIQFTTGSSAGAGTFSLTAPALTGVISGDMRLFLGSSDQTDTSGGGTTNNATQPAGFAERVDGGRTNATNSQLEICDLLASGSAGSVSATWNAQAFNAPSWIGVQLALSSDVVPTATPPLPRAFQEQGRIYSGETTGFQNLAFQIPDPGRAFQEGGSFGEPKAFQDQAFQQPDPTWAFQPEAFDDATSFQMSVLAFQEPTAYQGDAFQESLRQGVAAPLTTITAAGGIPSAEAFGVPIVRFLVRATGIASAEAFGVTKVIRIVGPTGVASSEAFGTPKLVTSIIRSVGGIASAEAFGVTRVRFVVSPIGIASAQAFGTPFLASPQYVSNAGGISSAQAFGVTHVLFVVRPIGVTSSEAFGTPKLLSLIIKNAGAIASAESFGLAHVLFVVRPIGIASREAIGILTISTAYNIFSVGGIASAESFGVTRVRFVVGVVGITSAQAFGAPRLPRLLRQVTGIASAEAFGTTRVRFVIGTVGIATREAFGTPTKSPQIIWPGGIGSREAFGRPLLFDATIQSASAYGKVFLSALSVFALVVDDAPVYAASADAREVFRSGLDDELRFTQGTKAEPVFAGVVDDYPPGG